MTYAGRLAVATPSLTDGNFDRTVVLLLAHSEADGALGVVLNRVSRVPVAAVLPDWADAVAEPTAVFSGGPVQPEVALCVAMARAGEQPPGWSPLTGRLGTIDFGVPVEEVLPYVERARLFAGYAGWSPANWRRRSPPGHGSCSTCCPATRSPRSPRRCGPRCCAGRGASPRRSPSSRRTPH